MFRKFAMIVVAMIGLSVSVVAKDTYTRDVSVLPKAAQTILSNNFKAKVNIVKIDKELGRISDFEVILTDGTEITFDRDGNWDNIEVGNKGTIPAAFIPAAISSYVKKNQPGQKILGIEKNRSGYEVELSNGVEMKFDKTGDFIKYD